MEPISWGTVLSTALGGAASIALSSMIGGGKGGGGQQAPQAASTPPEAQAAKTPTVQAFERQNAQAEGPMAGGAGSTLLTSAGLGAGTLGKSKTLGA